MTVTPQSTSPPSSPDIAADKASKVAAAQAAKVAADKTTKVAADKTTKVAADQATEVGATAQDKAAEVGAAAQDKATEVASEAKGHAQELLAESRRSMRSQAESQGEQLAHAAKDLAGELKSMASAGEGRLGGLMEQGADQLTLIADRFEQGGLDAVSGDARRFARNRPVAFLASTFAAGFAAGRLLKHSDNDELQDAVTSGGNELSRSRESAGLPASAATS